MCPRLIPRVSFLKRPGIGKSLLRYEKHTLKPYYYEFEESNVELIDEIKFGSFGNIRALKQIENGSINPKDLGIKL